MLRILLLLSALVVTPLVAQNMSSGGPVDITSDELDVQQAKGLATFSGNVTVTQGGFTLQAPKVVADYASSGKDTDIQSITASGGVVITRGGQGGQPEKATGTTAVYTPSSQQLVLTGAVTLTRGPSQLSGDKLVYDIASGNARVTNSSGPVKARFVPGTK